MKLTLQDINTTPKKLKTERDCSHRQLFRPLWGSSVWLNNQRSGSDEKISVHSDFSPDPELLTPAESRHITCLLGEKSPSVKLMSRRENKELAKTNLKNMDKTRQKLQHIRSIDALTLLRPGVAQKALFASRILNKLLPT